MELVAYHIYHLEERTKEIPWRKVTPKMIKKYEKFNNFKMCLRLHPKNTRKQPRRPKWVQPIAPISVCPIVLTYLCIPVG